MRVCSRMSDMGNIVGKEHIFGVNNAAE